MCTFQSTVNDVNVSYILLNVMIKNQQIKGKFKLGLPFYKLRRRDKLLFTLLLQFTLYVVSHFAKFLNALSCSPIMLVQVLQIWIIFINVINRDSIWCNWEGLCWHYILQKSLRAFSLNQIPKIKCCSLLWKLCKTLFWMQTITTTTTTTNKQTKKHCPKFLDCVLSINSPHILL